MSPIRILEIKNKNGMKYVKNVHMSGSVREIAKKTDIMDVKKQIS